MNFLILFVLIMFSNSYATDVSLEVNDQDLNFFTMMSQASSEDLYKIFTSLRQAKNLSDLSSIVPLVPNVSPTKQASVSLGLNIISTTLPSILVVEKTRRWWKGLTQDQLKKEAESHLDSVLNSVIESDRSFVIGDLKEEICKEYVNPSAKRSEELFCTFFYRMFRYSYLKLRSERMRDKSVSLLINSFESSFDPCSNSENCNFENWCLEEIRKNENGEDVPIIPMIFDEESLLNALPHKNSEDIFYDAIDYGHVSDPKISSNICSQPTTQSSLKNFVVSRYNRDACSSILLSSDKQRVGLAQLLLDDHFNQANRIKPLDRISTQIALSHP